MVQSVKIESTINGIGLPGYTVKLYNWSSGTSGYTGSALYTFTDGSNGMYYVDCSETFKGTVVITHSSYSTFISVPEYLKGTQWHGNNMAELAPPVSS